MSNITLAPQQEEAMRAILAWVDKIQQGEFASLGDTPYFVLTGYAGTGKTTLMQFLIEEIGASRITCATVTGKAMNVLKRKVGDEVTTRTIHNLLYKPISSPAFRNLLHQLRNTSKESPQYEELIKRYRKMAGKDDVGFDIKEDQDDTSEILIVDEASMLSEWMFNDLKELNKPILMVGDDMQLPPVAAKSIFESLGVQARLTEVHRQALDNPILRLATAIREGDTETVRQWRRHKFDIGMAMRAGKVLCYTNRTRHNINRMIRKQRGYDSETPVKGDTLICTRNASGYAWVNGAECEALSDFQTNGGAIGEMEVAYEGNDRGPTDAYIHDCVKNYRDCPELAMSWDELPQTARCFDYGYAITVHKAQGSEWDNVLLYDDAKWVAKRNGMAARQRWLYTAVTRAKENLAWVE